jgi:hypothetical protein
MPQLKQPMTQKDKSLQECVNLYCGTCERWISKLRQAQATGRLAYWNMKWSVLADCRQIERSLSEFPYFIIEMMSPQLTRKFAKMIEEYNDDYPDFNPRFDSVGRHISLCIAMFRSVLTPYVYNYDDETFSHPFTQILVVQTLDKVPGLRTLHLTDSSRGYDQTQLARMIRRLRHLQEFTYEFLCTDEVIEQLASHCTHLKKVSLLGSRHVTNASFQHLLQLRELQFLDLEGTLIDNEHYGLLLSKLPQIKNISFDLRGMGILDHVAEKDLHKMSHVRGDVWNISMVAQWCRNVTNLDIIVYGTPLDLSGLAALTTLRTVRFSHGNYVTRNMNAVLTGIGPRLTDLTLESVKNVNLQDIVTLCPLLASLSLLECKLLPLEPNTALDPQLPHFRNLISLYIINDDQDETIYNYIRHYIGLKKIRLEGIHIFNVEFMREVIRSGTLAHLEEFRIDEYRPGGLTMDALEMLIEHCSQLKSMGYLRYCCSLNLDFLQELELRLLVRNPDVEFIHVR